MVRAWHGRGMANVNQTWPHCVNQMGKTHSKFLAARHGRGTAWARHAMCESDFNSSFAIPGGKKQAAGNLKAVIHVGHRATILITGARA
jgi:hypothetical protein